jgi:hypothetical protein
MTALLSTCYSYKEDKTEVPAKLAKSCSKRLGAFLDVIHSAESPVSNLETGLSADEL